MRNLKLKVRERVLAAFLALAMIITMIPANAIAASEQHPEKFTLTVQDENKNALSDVQVSYAVTESESDTTLIKEGDQTTASDGSIAINGVKVGNVVTYSIEQDGYEPKKDESYTVTDTKENVDIKLVTEKKEFHKVIVKSGEGGTVQFDREYISNEYVSEVTAEKGEKVELLVKADENHRIENVRIGEEQYTDFTDDGTVFKKEIEIGKEDITAEVTYVEVHKVTIKYDKDTGKIEKPSEGLNDKDGRVDIKVNDGGELEIKASPTDKNSHRVSKVSIKGANQEEAYVKEFQVNGYTYTYSAVEGKKLIVDQDYEIEVTFANNVYNISLTGKDGNGTVYIDDQEVDTTTITAKEHGTQADFKFKAEDGWQVANISVNENVYDREEGDIGEGYSETEDGNIEYTVSKLTEDVKISVKFEKIPSENVNTPNGNEYYSIEFYPQIVNESDSNGIKVITLPKDGYFILKATKKEGYKYIRLRENKVLGKKINEPSPGKGIEIREEIDFQNWCIDVSNNEYFWNSTKNKTKTYNAGLIVKIDENAPNVEFILDGSDVNKKYYTEDFNVKVYVTDPELESGMQSITYWTEAGGNPVTQEETLYTKSAEQAVGAIEFTQYVGIDADLYNSNDVTMKVKVIDVEGNTYYYTSNPFDILKAPVVTFDINGELRKEENGNFYYESERTAEITIKDRIFEKSDKPVIKINAKDNDGTPVKDAWTIDWAYDSNTNVYKATILFEKDANYEWSFSYKNDAELEVTLPEEESKHPFKFTIDTTGPETVEITDGKNVWDKLLEVLTFGIWKPKEITVTATAKDKISGVKSIKYYKASTKTPLTETDLETKEFVEMPLGCTVANNDTFVVYVKAEDYSGNVSYASTDGLIVDKTPCVIEPTPDEPNKNNIYNKDVNIGVKVTDPGTSYSGIKQIDYQVVCDGNKENPVNLYKFDKTKPSHDELETEISKSFVVKSEDYNSSDVEVIITAEDNAGNKTTEKIALDIDVTKPEVKVDFGDDKAQTTDEDERGYFNSPRKATVTITERSNHFFDVAKAEELEELEELIEITATDNAGITVKGFNKDKMIGEWTTKEGSTPDEAEHSAVIEFDVDANYTFDISYTDKAGNTCEKVDYAKSDSPNRFTVDTSGPEVINVEEGTHFWDKLLEILTFGIWNPKEIIVTATAVDSITGDAPVKYYKASTTKPLTVDELKTKQFETKKDGYKVEDEDTFVVYVKAEDPSGNVSYASTDGLIVDKTPCVIEPTPDEPNKNNIYNKDVNIGVKVTDPGTSYSGIKQIDYQVICDGKADEPVNLFKFDKTKPSHDELENVIERNITIDSERYNSSDVKVIITAEDNAGNKSDKEIKLDIDVTVPTIAVSYDNNTANKVVNGRGYFKADRTATVVVTERTNHFDKAAALEAVKTAISAVNVKEEELEEFDVSKIVDAEWTTKENGKADDATHTLKVHYNVDANYTFDMSYTDMADNESSDVTYAKGTVAPDKFTVDKVAPTGSVTASAEDWLEDNTWDALIEADKFNFYRWTKKGIEITGENEDPISPTEKIQYFKTASDTAKTESELKAYKDWKDFDTFTVRPNEQFTVYLKFTDYAGNVRYISTNGMIADNESPHEETVAPVTTISPMQPVNGIYNTDVNVDIEVIDPIVGDTYSGLREVKYEVFNMGELTQEGVLYPPTEAEAMTGLQQTWTGSITVDKTLNNSNDVTIRVYAIDNAKNESERMESIKIDVTEPSIAIRYDNNSIDSEKYYKENRTATVVISERNFDEKDVVITAEGGHGNKPAISGWTKTPGTGNLDDTTYTATISYTADDDYQFAIAYTDLAGNVCPGETYAEGTTNPKEFTVDKTIPTMDVTYDNNSALNGNYYKAERTATIRIVEHNFDASRATIQVNATDNGSAVTAPGVSGWTTSGDVHTATIHYANDALYTFNLAYTDMAGNQAAPFTEEKFYVDKTNPAVNVTKIVDESANTGKDNIGFVLTATDTNFDVFKPVLTAVVREGQKFVTKTMDAGTITDTANGKVFTVENLDTDGIYSLTCEVVDKAGNAYDEITLYDKEGTAYTEKRTAQDNLVTFSVNRDGSTYRLSSFTTDLNEGYVYEVYEDIVIEEINADPLKKHTVTVNGKTLKEDKDYTVKESTGEGEWHKYTYTVGKEYFKNEGEYAVVVSSQDKADSNAYSDVKGASVKFTVDKTAPVVTVSGLANDGRYQVQEQTVTVIPTDDGGKLKSILCEVLDRDGNVVKKALELSGEEFEKALKKGDGKLTFTIDEGMYQNVRIVCKDSALNDKGDTNTYKHVYKNVTVSSNIFKIFWANTALRYGVLIGLAVAVGAFLFFIIAKKKKEEEEEQK